MNQSCGGFSSDQLNKSTAELVAFSYILLFVFLIANIASVYFFLSHRRALVALRKRNLFLLLALLGGAAFVIVVGLLRIIIGADKFRCRVFFVIHQFERIKSRQQNL